jgi:hypothetical protein
VSKKSILKKRLEQEAKNKAVNEETVKSVNTPQSRSMIFPYRRKRRLSRRFIIFLAIWIVGLIIALIYLSRLS